MARYRQPEGRDWLIMVGAVVLCIGVVTICALILMSGGYRYLWVGLFAVALYLLVRWHASVTAYRCTRCGHEFEIGVVTDLVSPHGPGRGGGWKYLKCPSCGRRSKARVLVKTPD